MSAQQGCSFGSVSRPYTTLNLGEHRGQSQAMPSNFDIPPPSGSLVRSLKPPTDLFGQSNAPNAPTVSVTDARSAFAYGDHNRQHSTDFQAAAPPTSMLQCNVAWTRTSRFIPSPLASAIETGIEKALSSYVITPEEQSTLHSLLHQCSDPIIRADVEVQLPGLYRDIRRAIELAHWKLSGILQDCAASSQLEQDTIGRPGIIKSIESNEDNGMRDGEPALSHSYARAEHDSQVFAEKGPHGLLHGDGDPEFDIHGLESGVEDDHYETDDEEAPMSISDHDENLNDDEEDMENEEEVTKVQSSQKDGGSRSPERSEIYQIRVHGVSLKKSGLATATVRAKLASLRLLQESNANLPHIFDYEIMKNKRKSEQDTEQVPKRLLVVRIMGRGEANKALVNGIVWNNVTYRCSLELNAPNTQSQRCGQCQRFGHEIGECHRESICGKCAGSHKVRDCDTCHLRCANCKGSDHGARNKSCPMRKAWTEEVNRRFPTPERFSPTRGPLSSGPSILREVESTMETPTMEAPKLTTAPKDVNSNPEAAIPLDDVGSQFVPGFNFTVNEVEKEKSRLSGSRANYTQEEDLGEVCVISPEEFQKASAASQRQASKQANDPSHAGLLEEGQASPSHVSAMLERIDRRVEAMRSAANSSAEATSQAADRSRKREWEHPMTRGHSDPYAGRSKRHRAAGTATFADIQPAARERSPEQNPTKPEPSQVTDDYGPYRYSDIVYEIPPP